MINVRPTTLFYVPSVMDVAIVLLFFVHYSDIAEAPLAIHPFRSHFLPGQVFHQHLGRVKRAKYCGTLPYVAGSHAAFPGIVAW